MSIKIEKTKCVGCARCTAACPGSLIYMKKENGKAFAAIREVRDCWGCTACLKECPSSAIKYFLGADIGGTGATLSIKRESHYLHWKINLPSGTEKIITIDQKEANKY